MAACVYGRCHRGYGFVSAVFRNTECVAGEKSLVKQLSGGRALASSRAQAVSKRQKTRAKLCVSGCPRELP